ncbi:MAG: zinc-ribbon domain-containing protein [Desulfobulbaceae bacterium]|nr:zinc-ribbon domain-containing protein [Desulfobulbaceae bacterium]
MVVICEECAKKYNVDERKIKGERATFNCKQCSHHIIVQKPKLEAAPRSSSVTAESDPQTGGDQRSVSQRASVKKQAGTKVESAGGAEKVTGPKVVPQNIVSSPQLTRKKKKPSMSVGMHFLVAVVIGFATITGGIGYLYFFYIPEVMGKEVDISILFSSLSLTIVAGIWFVGIIAFFFLARFITKPLQELTAIVHRISLGELDLTIEPKGPREIQELAKACDRMRYSIKEAIKRLKSK